MSAMKIALAQAMRSQTLCDIGNASANDTDAVIYTGAGMTAAWTTLKKAVTTKQADASMRSYNEGDCTGY